MRMDDELERDVARAIGRLPAPRAPDTLLPRVMTAVATRKARASARPWFTWPWPAQAASLAMALVVLAAVTWAWPAVVDATQQWLPRQVQAGTSYMAGTADTAAVVLRLLHITWAAVIAPIARTVLLLTVILCAACAVCVAALGRVALGGASHS